MGSNRIDAEYRRSSQSGHNVEQPHGPGGESLVRLLQRFCVVAQGIDRDLDEQIKGLLKVLRGPSPEAQISPLAESLERGILQVLQRREDGVKISQQSLSKLLRELGRLADDAQLTGQLGSLQRDLNGCIENYYEYPRLLKELAHLQKRVLDLHPLGKGDKSAVDEQRSRGRSDDKNHLCRHIGELLLKIIQQLTIPQDMLPKTRSLMTQIEAGFGWGDLELVLKDAVDLAVRATATGHQDFESYLYSLNTQLSDIQSYLGESRLHQSEALASSRELDRSLRDNVARVEVCMAEADSLDQLKRSVHEQLENVVGAVDRFRDQQSVRESQAEKRLQQLQQKIDLMESKATEVQAHLEEQRLRAMSDPLTGLPNRAAYDDCINEQHALAGTGNQPLTLVICDLDHFKAVNDSLGHLAGDKVLRLVAKILRGGLRKSDFVGRYGGEEFVIVQPGTSASQSLEVMEKLRRVMEQSPFNFKGQPVRVTMSFGIAQNLVEESPDGLFSRADSALYRAKEKGRNRCVIAD